ncbi:MAG: hypothetical protein AAFN65_15245, partial [Bacteroidota bacterium]
EVVSYHYDRGGKLNRMDSRHLDFEYTYISEILYDKFEQRTSITYGNGAATTYSYDPERRWLEQMQASSEEAGQFCNMQYGFDLVGNITSLDNLAEQTNVPGGIGGRYSHSYEYDPLYRLISAQGQWTQAGLTSEYGLDMGYDNLHNIEFKSQRVTRNGLEVNDQTYDREYLYDQDRPHLPSRIGDFAFTADANGNLTSQVNQVQLQNRRLIWDEENRLQQVNDGGYISQNTFDASGIRTIKSHGPGSGVTIDGTEVGFISHEDNWTAFISPNLVVRPEGFTKHYSLEGQRIASRMGVGQFQNNLFSQFPVTAGQLNYLERMRLIREAVTNFYFDLGLPPGHPANPDRPQGPQPPITLNEEDYQLIYEEWESL